MRAVRWQWLGASVGALAVVAGACSDDDDTSAEATLPAIVTTTTDRHHAPSDDHPAALLRGPGRRHAERDRRRLRPAGAGDHGGTTASPTQTASRSGRSSSCRWRRRSWRPRSRPSPRRPGPWHRLPSRRSLRRLSAMSSFWPTPDHWSVRIPLDTPHLRPPPARRDVASSPSPTPISRSRRASTRRSSTWTGRAAATPTSPRSRRPTASSTAAGSGTRARPTRTRCWTSNAEVVPTVRDYVDAVGANFGRVRVIKLEPQDA